MTTTSQVTIARDGGAPSTSCNSAPVSPGAQIDSFDDGCHRDDMALELEVRAVEPGGDADQLREMENRHLEVLARLLAQLELPGVQ